MQGSAAGSTGIAVLTSKPICETFIKCLSDLVRGAEKDAADSGLRERRERAEELAVTLEVLDLLNPPAAGGGQYSVIVFEDSSQINTLYDAVAHRVSGLQAALRSLNSDPGASVVLWSDTVGEYVNVLDAYDELRRITGAPKRSPADISENDVYHEEAADGWRKTGKP